MEGMLRYIDQGSYYAQSPTNQGSPRPRSECLTFLGLPVSGSPAFAYLVGKDSTKKHAVPRLAMSTVNEKSCGLSYRVINQLNSHIGISCHPTVTNYQAI